jgi:hypothetical protein
VGRLPNGNAALFDGLHKLWGAVLENGHGHLDHARANVELGRGLDRGLAFRVVRRRYASALPLPRVSSELIASAGGKDGALALAKYAVFVGVHAIEFIKTRLSDSSYAGTEWCLSVSNKRPKVIEVIGRSPEGHEMGVWGMAVEV